ncbi:MAG: DUF5615 family PIN-like protein [Armatimonadota bacterium]|nr:DUF5615 family PIN-like protein [bacterium]MCS7310079.1 DUF5615 family PIN-like protein [Armatimonadota bacterium]MDW8290669.1 DUF5615 family PIN-like protein [Armatimonadota bacterium]
MTLRSFRFLADENIHPDVVQWMRSQQIDVISVREQGWTGTSDRFLLETAHQLGRVVVTHDADFGTLTIARGVAFTGVVYLRPGHIQPSFVIQTLQAILDMPLNLTVPFLVVAYRAQERVRVRVRTME